MKFINNRWALQWPAGIKNTVQNKLIALVLALMEYIHSHILIRHVLHASFIHMYVPCMFCKGLNFRQHCRALCPQISILYIFTIVFHIPILLLLFSIIILYAMHSPILLLHNNYSWYILLWGVLYQDIKFSVPDGSQAPRTMLVPLLLL